MTNASAPYEAIRSFLGFKAARPGVPVIEARLTIRVERGHESLLAYYVGPTGSESVRVMRSPQVEIPVTAAESGGILGHVVLARYGEALCLVDLEEAIQKDFDRYEITVSQDLTLPGRLAFGARDVVRMGEDVFVTWGAPTNPRCAGYALSLAAREEDLFTEQSLTLRADGDASSRGQKVAFPGPGVAAVRMLDEDDLLLEENRTAVAFEGWNGEPFDAGVTGISASHAEITGVPGDVITVTATAEGGGGVLFEMSPGAGTASATGEITLGRSSGELTLRSALDPSVYLTVPVRIDLVTPAQLAPKAEDGGDGKTARVLWTPVADDPARPQVSYRVYWSQANDFSALDALPHVHTTKAQVTITGLRGTVYFHVRAEDLEGRTKGATTGPVTLSARRQLPVALRTALSRSCRIAPGETLSYNLEELFAPIPLPDADSPWHDVSFLVRAVGGSVCARLVGRSVVMNVPAGAAPSQEQTIVLVRLSRPKSVPVWAAWCAQVGLETEQTTPCLSGMHRSAVPSDVRISMEALVGEEPRVITQESWADELARYADPLSYWIDEGVLRLAPSARGEDPEILVLSGSEGYSCILVSREGHNPYLLPALPEGTMPEGALRVETRLGWTTVRWADLLADEEAVLEANWTRLLVGDEGEPGSRLYDISPFAPPVRMHYAAPTYYRNLWFDYALYPGDVRAELVSAPTGGKAVLYRNGLRGPAAPESLPRVSLLRAEPAPGRVELTWRVFHQALGDRAIEGLEVPVRLRKKGTTRVSTHIGYSRATFEHLASNTEYEAWLLLDDPYAAKANGYHIEFRTPRLAPAIRVEGYVEEAPEGDSPGSYRYRYYVPSPSGDPYATWADPITGEEHTSPVFEVTNETAISEHTIALRYANETIEATATTEWLTPQATFEFKREVTTGFSVPADLFEAPVFRRLLYAGTSQKDLPHNTYSPGRYRVRASGWVPPTLGGRLEDYVQVSFVGPDGKELGESVALEVPTELAVRVRVTAKGGESAFVTGVRIERRA